MELKQFELKHSIKPYSFVFVVICVVSISWMYITFTSNNWNAWWWPLPVLAVYLLKIYFFDLRYSIFYNEETITMQVATWFPTPRALTSIKIADITNIQEETSNLRTLVAQRRVSQRIAIYDKPHQKFIDVSLKHFVQEGTRELMNIIKARRPDLSVPMV